MSLSLVFVPGLISMVLFSVVSTTLAVIFKKAWTLPWMKFLNTFFYCNQGSIDKKPEPVQSCKCDPHEKKLISPLPPLWWTP